MSCRYSRSDSSGGNRVSRFQLGSSLYQKQPHSITLRE